MNETVLYTCVVCNSCVKSETTSCVELAVIIEGSIILCDIKQHSKVDLCYREIKIEKEELGKK